MFVQFSIRQKQNLLEKPNSCMIDFKIRFQESFSLSAAKYGILRNVKT
jgi:hypothetical protein